MLIPMIMLSMTLSIMFLFMKHPLSMGLILIIQTIIVSLMTGIMINTFWFSYILLITMLSGMLVLFIYMASVASNEKFYTSTKMIMFAFSSLIIILMTSVMSEYMSNDLWTTIKKINLNNDQVMSLIKMFNLQNMLITIMIVSYLFMTMIVISYIVNVFEGPLRTKN